MENIYDIEICPDLNSDEKKINIDCNVKMMIILLMFLIQYQLENCCFNWL